VVTTSRDEGLDQKVLLVEDDDGIATPLAAALGGGGYVVTRVATGREALARATDDLAAVVLDLGLPDIDGVEVCRRLHVAHPGVPVLMLTARTSEADVVVGLDAGADDYVTKPFRLAELLARLRALIRRARPGTPQGAPHRVGGAGRAGRPGRAARLAGRAELDLTPKEFDLLAMLVREAGHGGDA
jgi:DNA-binding response OmpR family regulator